MPANSREPFRLVSRRTVLRTIAATGTAALFPKSLFAKEEAQSDLLRYLESLARADGGYAWEDQERSHLTPTFAVIGCYRALKTAVPRTEQVVQFVRTHHPSELKKLEQERRVFD